MPVFGKAGNVHTVGVFADDVDRLLVVVWLHNNLQAVRLLDLVNLNFVFNLVLDCFFVNSLFNSWYKLGECGLY